MKIKFLLPFLLLLSCISAQAQISVTVQSGIGQTFFEEDVNFRQFKDPNPWPLREYSGFSVLNNNPSYFFGAYIAYPIAANWKVQAGIEMHKQKLLYYWVTSPSRDLYLQFRPFEEPGVSMGSNSFPVNLVYENMIWKDRVFTSFKAGFAYTTHGYSHLLDGYKYQQVSYGVDNNDTTMFSFLIFRSEYTSRSRKMVLFNTAASLGWKFSDYWQVEAGMHYRHGFRTAFYGEASLYDYVEVTNPNTISSRKFMERVAHETYNNETPHQRHAFTTNGSALFGTLALTYTFAKKEKDK